MFVRYVTDHRRRLVSGRTLAAIVSALFAALPACAATWTWDGGAGNDNWTNGQNWVGDVSPVNDGTADIVFAGTTRLTPNLPINWSINSLTFDNTAGAFDLKSTPQSNLTIGAGGITTFSANRQAFEHLVTLSAPQTWTSGSNSGGLGFPLFAPVVNGGHLLTMNVDGGSINLEGTLKGSGGLTKEGLGDLVLFPVVIVAGGNSFTGATNVNSGQLYLRGHELLTTIPGELRIGDGVGATIESVVNQNHNQIANSSSVSIASTGSWDLSNFSEAITNLEIVSAGVANGASVTMTSGALTVLGSLTMTGGAVTASAGGKLSLTGNVITHSSNFAAQIGSALDLKFGAHTLLVDNGAAPHDLDVTGVVSNGALVKDGLGALRLAGANIYAGGTTLNAGAIEIGHDSALGTGSLTVNGGTLQADGGSRKIANFLNLNAGFEVDGAFDLTLDAPVNLDGAITKNGVGTLTFANSSAIGGMLTVNAGAIRLDADVSVGGGLANSGTVLVAQTLTVNGAGFNNQGSLTFVGGSLSGSGPIVNNAIVSGSGTIGGTTGFANNAQLTVSGGNLTLANTGQNANGANINVNAGLQLQLTGGTLANTGAVILDGGVVVGSATLSNIAGGVVSGHGLISMPFANSGGTLRVVGGTMNVTGVFTNNGVIRIDDGAGLVGGAITNSGRIQGDGSIANPLTNSAGGSIRVDAGRTLFFRGAFAANAGEMNLQGGTLDFINAITNSSSGFISGRGALYTGGLTNNGQMAFSGGATDIHGDVALNAGSRAVTSGSGATTTFFDDVTHNGTEIFTGAGASTVIFGALSGAGPFTGAGTVYSIGDLRPGNSPATVSFGGALVLGSSTALTMELGGLAAGTQHDRLAIAGTVSLAGSLKVSLLDGFVPSAGNSFEIVTAAGGIAGTFGSAHLPVLEDGMAWSLVYGVNSVVIQIGLLGDYNRNGVVDGADYIVYRNTLGQTGVGLWADGNNNNQIDTGDYAVWRTRLGATGVSGLGFSANDAVPEPTSLAMVTLCGAALAIRRTRRVRIRMCLLAALFFPAAAHGASYSITDLGVLGAENTLGWGINASGQVTGYAGTSGEDTITAFVWSPTTPNTPTGALHRLGTLGGYFSWGIGINASGQVAGLSSTTDDEAEHATLWNPTTPNGSTGTLHDLGTLGGTYSQGTGINDGGQLTGYADLTGDQESRAIMWKPTTAGSSSGTMYDLGSLGGSHSFGWDINAAGQVAGDSSTTDNVATHAMLWKPISPNGTVGTMHDLGTLGGNVSGGEGINNHGQVAGYSQTTNDAADHAFLWTPSTPGGIAGAMLDLGTLGGVDSYGLAVSNNGHVVGSSAVPAEISNNYHAFIYASGTGMVDLNTLIDPLSGWELLDADDINDAGQITGQGLINGEYHAFLLTPVPIPGDFNHNGTVDAADYVVWRKGIGVASTPDNYNIWRQHFGQTAFGGPGNIASANVPEPTTLPTLTFAAACLLLQRRRSHAALEHLIDALANTAVITLTIVSSAREEKRSIRRQYLDNARSIPAAYVFASMLLITTQAVPAYGQILPGTYSLSSATATPANWAQNWTAQLAGTSGWTGADGLYVIPMNGNRKLGSAYETPGWQTFSFNDSLIGTVNELDQRTGFRFINNSIGVYSGTGATPTPISFKWKGNQNPPFDSTESMITGPVAGGLYWPLDGIVVPRIGGGQQFVQFAMKINGGLTPTGVGQMTWPIPDGVNYAANWPYNGNRGDTWFSSIDSIGPLPNLYKPDPDGSGPTGELVMGTAILDISNASTSYTSNGYVHIYGTRNDFLSKKVFVARAAPTDVSNPSAWSFWNASSSAWVSGASAINSATPMRDTSNATLGDMAVEYSVTQLPDGRYVMVYLHADALGTQISARYSSAPQGPWSSRQLLYNVSVPNSGNPALGLPDISTYSDWKYVIYGAKAHAQLSEAPSGSGAANAGQLLISFNVNNWKTNGSTSQPDPGWIYGSIYRPRFISVDILGSLPGDFNNNGTVDAADYVVWRKTGINGPSGYHTWRTNFGNPSGSGSVAGDNAAVPEPRSIVLVTMGAIVISMLRVRRTKVMFCLSSALWFAPAEQVALADIYQWEYVNPANPSLGKKASATVAPGGAGVSASPGTNLSGRNLTKAYLIGANLSLDVVFDGDSYYFYPADLSGVNLSQADLSNANLYGAVLAGTNFTDAEVHGANLSYSAISVNQLYATASFQAHDLASIDLAGNNLAGANLANQNLTGASFAGATLTSANLSQANLTNASFSSTNLAGANLSGANFSGVELGSANLNGTNVTPVQLYSTSSYQNGTMTGLVLANTNLAGVDLSNKHLSFTSFLNANLTNANLTNVKADRAVLIGANLTGAVIQGAVFTVDFDYEVGSGLTPAQLYSTASYQAHDLSGITLYGNNLAGANLVGQNLENAKFGFADLTNSNLSHANLRAVDFGNATLTGANISGATIRGANFNSSGLTPAQLYSTADYQAHDLTGIRLYGYGNSLAGVNLIGQNLTNAEFGGGNILTNANLSQANLTNANFSGAALTGAQFNGANVQGANFAKDAPFGTGLTLAQLYSTASYAAHELSGIVLTSNNLAGANLTSQNLTSAKLDNATLTNANLSNSNLTNASLGSIPGANLTGAEIRGATILDITKSQLSSTASYLAHDLTGVRFYGHDLAGSNLANHNLTNAEMLYADLNNTNFSNANLTNAQIWAGLTGANFTGAIIRNAEFTDISKAQIYSTASYQAHDLSGIRLPYNSNFSGINLAAQNLTSANLKFANLTGADFSHANVTNADFSGVFYCDEYSCYASPGANLTNANLTGVDARGANFQEAILTGAIMANFIQTDGHIAGLNLTSGNLINIRDYDGNPNASPPIDQLPVIVDQQLAMDATGTLRMIFDADAWGSTISFQPNVSVSRNGTLDLTFAPEINLASQVGRTIDLFDWTGVAPTGTFNVSSPYTWNLSNLYTTGEVTLTAVPGVVPGDFNGSGAVDAADYIVWRKGLGTTFSPSQYDVWRAHFGQTAGSASGAGANAVVPEPASVLMFLVGLVAMCSCRRSAAS